MTDYREFFKGKKITVMGLGLLGRGLGYTKFLAECGADLIVTDLKSKEQLKTSIKQLSKFKNIKYTLGEHKLEDFRNRDIIMKMAGVPKNSIYLKEAKKTGAEIEMDVSLFSKLVPEVMIIGVTGTRGKSMTTALIYEILSKNTKKQKVFLGGNVRGVATLPFLKEVKPGDILVCELDSWQLQGFGEAKISPHISVFISFMPDHMNYYGGSMQKYFADKAKIFKYQNKNDFLIVRPHVKKLLEKKINPVRSRPREASATVTLGRSASNGIKSRIIVSDLKKVADYDFVVPGEHQRENLSCAVEVAKLFKIPEENIRKTVRNFKGVEGRLQYVKSIKGVKIYNDNNATTPEATMAGIKALYQEGKEDKIILISGGADKKLDLSLYVNVVNTFCKAVVFIPGTGTDGLIKNYKLRITNEIGKDLKDVVNKAIAQAKKGDIILFSPAFASFGMFNNEYERNDQFLKIIKNLK